MAKSLFNISFLFFLVLNMVFLFFFFSFKFVITDVPEQVDS